MSWESDIGSEGGNEVQQSRGLEAVRGGGKTIPLEEAAGVLTPQSVSGTTDRESEANPLPPIIVKVEMLGHNDHSSGEFAEFAPADEGYDFCVCHSQFEVAYEGLWRFSVDPKHPEVRRAFREGLTVVIEQEVETQWEKTSRKNRSKSTERFYAAEWIPVGTDGSTKPDPHWGGVDYSEFCGMTVTESIRARAALMKRTGAQGASFPPVFKFESESKGPFGPPEGFSQVEFKAETPWSKASSVYTPYHCLARYYTPGSNVGPRSPDTGRGVPTPPDLGGGGGTPTPRRHPRPGKEDPGEIRHGPPWPGLSGGSGPAGGDVVQ